MSGPHYVWLGLLPFGRSQAVGMDELTRRLEDMMIDHRLDPEVDGPQELRVFKVTSDYEVTGEGEVIADDVVHAGSYLVRLGIGNTLEIINHLRG